MVMMGLMFRWGVFVGYGGEGPIGQCFFLCSKICFFLFSALSVVVRQCAF